MGSDNQEVWLGDCAESLSFSFLAGNLTENSSHETASSATQSCFFCVSVSFRPKTRICRPLWANVGWTSGVEIFGREILGENRASFLQSLAEWFDTTNQGYIRSFYLTGLSGISFLLLTIEIGSNRK